MSKLADSIENCDRSQRLELEDSIESMPSNPKHSEGESVIGDLPTRTINVLPFGHPFVRVASAFAEEGIYMRKIIVQLNLNSGW
jgi:hypothetical protein